MRKEFVYSVMALGAIPITVNAAEVQQQQINSDVLASTDGSKVTYAVGKLAPGKKYSFKAKLTSKVCGVTVEIFKKGTDESYGKQVFDAKSAAQDVEINFEVGSETDFELTLAYTDAGDVGVGSGFTVTDAVISLDFDFAKLKTTLAGNAGTLAGTIGGYNYAAKEDDVKAANALKKKANDVDETYDDYTKFKLYATKSTIQEEIDALAASAAAKEAAYQNEQAYNRVNAAITAIKGKLGTAQATLQTALNGTVAAYLLDAALNELDTQINQKITDATQASYASYQAGTAVADEATNTGLVPTEEALNTIVGKWIGQATDNINAYNNLHVKVTGFQTRVNNVKPKSDGIAAAYPTTEAEAAIAALNTKIENAKNSADQLDLDVTTEEAAAQKKVKALEDNVAKANAEYDANKDTEAAIATLQTNLDNAKTAVNALKSTDGQYEAKNYYDAYVTNVQGKITKLSEDAAKAYKVDGTGSAQKFNADLNTADIQALIDAYAGTTEPAVDGMPKQAVAKYNDLQTAIAAYEKDLAAARDQVKDLAVYTADGYDYETSFDLIQKRINDIKKAITAAKGKVGSEHWTAMLAIDADAAITADIATLLTTVQADQNEYDATTLATGLTTLSDKITAFQAKDAAKLGADVAIYQGIETGINAAYTAVKTASEAIDAQSETVDYTAKVGTSKDNWHGGGTYGNSVELFGNTSVGVKLYQDVEVEDGIYDIEVLATSHNAWNGNYASYTDANGDNPAPALQEDADDVAYVFGKGDNEVQTWITARRNNGMAEGEPMTYAIKGVKVSNGKLTIGLALAKKGQTEWHTIQIKSLKATTASLIQGWGAKIDELNAQQTALEIAAGDVAAKVAANTKAQSDLATSIDGLQDKINSFKMVYKLGQDDSTLGNRGKDGGSIDEAVDKIVTDLGTLETANNGFDPTAVTNVDKTDKFGKKKADWPSTLTYGEGENYAENNGTVESYKKTVEGIGVVLSQEVTGLANGIYDVVLTANANFTDGRGFNSDLVDGATDAAYVFANDKKANVVSHVDTGWTLQDIHINGVIVSDGTLKLGIGKYKAQTNWNAIQIKSLTYHENSQDATYNNDDPEALGYNDQYTALAKQEADLEKDAPNVKKAVENNAAANTAAQAALTALGTYELDNLKQLADVTNDLGNLSTSNSETNNAKKINAKKADPSNWTVFRSGLDADKTYTAKKNAIDATIAELTAAVAAANAAETLPSPWADEITVVTEDDPATPEVNEASSTTYKISEIKADITALKAEAGTESANYWGYRNTSKTYFNVNIDASKYVANADVATLALGTGTLDKEFPQAATDLATIEKTEGAGAEPYYTGLINTYKAERRDIIIKMLASLNGRTAVADNSARVNELKALVNKVKAIKGNADANLKKYTEQKTAYTEAQTLWNNTYTEIAATDQSSKAQDWLDELDAIQVTLTAATNAVEENYKVGESVAKAQDFAAIKAAINDVKARQAESYNEFIAADNKAAHESFMGYEKDGEHVPGAIDRANEAYKRAVQERAEFSSTNEEVKAAIDALAAELDKAIYSAPTDIAALTQLENDAYTGTVSPTVFDVSQYNADALDIEQQITDKLNTFKAGVKGALEGYWNPTKEELNKNVTAAETAIAGYSDAAKKDAFKDVKDLIDKADKGVTALKLSEIEDAIAALENIDAMLAADKDAAAAKDIAAANTAATNKYKEVKAYIEGKTIADDVNNVKATELQNLETANTAAVEALKKDKTFANHYDIKTALENVVTVATTAKTNVDNAITADVANTQAYNDIIAVLNPLKDKLAEAKAAAAPYKYPTSFEADEEMVAGIEYLTEQAKAQGSAAQGGFKGNMLDAVGDESKLIGKTLTNAFNTEKTGLAADITELKNQYNAYVAANGLDETATAFKKNIDDLQTALNAAAIKDLDDPADDIQFDEIVAATAALIKLQNDIADKETELLAANASTANADVLKDFQDQIAEMEADASLEGNDPWVGEQKVGGKAISDHIAEIQAQIADVKAAIEGEDNISFYKDQYQAKLDAIKDVLDPVAEAIADNQAKFTANAEAYKELTGIISDLDKAINDAKAKVGNYQYVGKPNYANHIGLLEYYGDPNDPTKLTAGAKYDLNQMSAQVEAANEAKNAQNYYPNTLGIVKDIQDYLDASAYDELDYQIGALRVALASAMNVGQFEEGYEPKYSSALWGTLLLASGVIDGEIDDLEYAVEYSNSDEEWDENGDPIPVYENELYVGNEAKDVTSDADYADQMEVVNAIKQEIADLATAVDNIGLLGDANEDTKVNVLDYQKVVNMILDPTQQPEEETNLFANIDINQNDIIEVGDLTAIVNYILTGDWQGYAAARSMNAEGESIAMNVSPMEQGKQRIAVSLANVSDYTAFQMDMVLPEGMTFVGASLSNRAGESHKLYSRAQLDGSIRVLASSIKGETFSGNEGAVLYIDVEGAGNVELVNILFSDVNAQTHLFTIGGDATGINNVSTFESLKQQVYDFGGRLVKGLKKGMNIIRRNDGSTDKVIVK